MRLSTEQISAIDTVLEQSGVVYIDYKFEILDHIATEVEDLIENEQMDFENAFTFVLKKWQPKFKKSASATFGYIWELPEILAQKAKKIYWRKMILLVIASFVLMGILLLIKDLIAEFTQNICYLLMGILAIQFIGYIKIRRSKQKTTYGFLYKQQFLAFFFSYFIPVSILSSNNNFLEKSVESVFPVFLQIAMLLIAPVMNFNFYKNHFEQLRKFNKLA